MKHTNVSYLNNCTNIYINDTIVNYNNNENDTSVKDAENTRGNKPCTNRGKKIRRGGRNMKHVKRQCSDYLKLLSTNAAGIINGKIDSLKSEIICTKANIVTIQETHCRKKGKIQIPGFVVFESIRTKKGGGTLIAAHEDLNPKLIEEYNTDFELLVVEIETKNKAIRIISGYGPQENLQEEKRLPFFISLETEIENQSWQESRLLLN